MKKEKLLELLYPALKVSSILIVAACFCGIIWKIDYIKSFFENLGEIRAIGDINILPLLLFLTLFSVMFILIGILLNVFMEIDIEYFSTLLFVLFLSSSVVVILTILIPLTVYLIGFSPMPLIPYTLVFFSIAETIAIFFSVSWYIWAFLGFILHISLGYY